MSGRYPVMAAKCLNGICPALAVLLSLTLSSQYTYQSVESIHQIEDMRQFY